MEFATLQAQIRAARQITKEVDGVRFTLELPSEHAWRLTIEGNRDAAGRSLYVQATGVILATAITGWNGLTARHLHAAAPADALAFSPEARTALIEERVDIADALMTEIGVKVAERREKRDGPLKN